MRVQHHKYTPEEKAFMIEYVPGHSHKEILSAFNEKFSPEIGLNQVKAYIKNNKLNTGRTGYFLKGRAYVPTNHNKGWEPTQFKTGNRPYNYLPVGTELIKNQGYVWIKIADPNVWKQKNQIIWEAEYGSIPKGHVLVFADGDRLNVCLENLMLVSRAELVTLNQKDLIKNDKALTESGLLVAKIIIKTRELKTQKR